MPHGSGAAGGEQRADYQALPIQPDPGHHFPPQADRHSITHIFMKLEGKVALVTGSAQGIGQGIAVRLAQEGADVVIDDRKADGAQETLRLVEAAGRRGVIVQGDLGKLEDDVRMVAEGVAHFGKIDILVNNAGVEKAAPFWEVTEQDYDFVLDINLKGTFFATQSFRAPSDGNQARAAASSTSVRCMKNCHSRILPRIAPAKAD